MLWKRCNFKWISFGAVFPTTIRFGRESFAQGTRYWDWSVEVMEQANNQTKAKCQFGYDT